MGAATQPLSSHAEITLAAIAADDAAIKAMCSLRDCETPKRAPKVEIEAKGTAKKSVRQQRTQKSNQNQSKKARFQAQEPYTVPKRGAGHAVKRPAQPHNSGSTPETGNVPDFLL